MSDHYEVDRSLAHASALPLMRRNFFWDVADEQAPFGSDEGHAALVEYREWQAENPDADLKEHLSFVESWFTGDDYWTHLALPAGLLLAPLQAWSSYENESETRDLSVIAAALGHLMDRGYLSPSARKIALVAAKRQRRVSFFRGLSAFSRARAVARAIRSAPSST